MNKKLICTAVGTTLAIAAGSAGAYWDPWNYYSLVPYVVKDANRTTVVTVMITDDSTTYAERLHIQYWTKSTTDANTAACQPSSVTVPVTPNDILTFDTAGILGYPLFGDTTNPAPLGMSISYAAPRHGYLIMESPYIANGTSLGIQGTYWLELDLANGGAHGDHGLNNDNVNHHELFEPSEVLEGLANYPDANNTAPVAFWPSSVASTVFTVTPLGTDMVNRENNQAVLQVFNSNAVQGAYDRNENGIDGTVPQTVRCVGRLTPAQLMPGVVANAAWAKQGGWGWLTNLADNNATSGQTQGGTNSGDLDVVVYQVDTASAAGKFMSNAVNISGYQGY